MTINNKRPKVKRNEPYPFSKSVSEKCRHRKISDRKKLTYKLFRMGLESVASVAQLVPVTLPGKKVGLAWLHEPGFDSRPKLNFVSTN